MTIWHIIVMLIIGGVIGTIAYMVKRGYPLIEQVRFVRLAVAAIWETPKKEFIELCNRCGFGWACTLVMIDYEVKHKIHN